MCHFENIWLENCFKPIVYRQFADDTILLCRSKEHIYLDINVSSKKFVKSVYCKPAFRGVFTDFERFIPDVYKRVLIETLLHSSFRLCSSYENFRQEAETLKSILKHTSYSHNFENRYIKKFLSKSLSKGTLVSWFLKESWFVFTIFQASLDLKTRLRGTIDGSLPYRKLKVIFRSKCRLSTLFRFKDPLEKKKSALE